MDDFLQVFKYPTSCLNVFFSTVSGMYEIALRGAFQDIVISWNGLYFYLPWLTGWKVSRHIRTMAILAKQIVTGSHFLCLASQTCKGSNFALSSLKLMSFHKDSSLLWDLNPVSLEQLHGTNSFCFFFWYWK